MTRTIRAAFACSLAAVVALVAAGPAIAAKSVPFQRSVTLAAWGPTAYNPALTQKRLATLKAREHVDTVTIIVVWNQDNVNSVAIRPGPEAAPDANIRAAIRAAKKLHLRVVLRPYIDPLDGNWRGAIHPSSIPAWFKSYDAFILHYAKLARQEHVDGLVVGSELATLSQMQSYWRPLVRSVRRRFSGFLTYQANWGGEEVSVNWWDALDAISISAYYPVAAQPGSTVSQLVDAWTDMTDEFGIEHHWYAQVASLRKRWHKPVMFGEIAYRPVQLAAVEPWNTELKGTDTKIQPAAYEAAFRVWYRVPWFRGMSWWYIAPEPALVAGQTGADHQPGPAALRTLRHWYAQKP